MKERFLPIGSIVLLKGGTKELMITGYCIVSEDALKDKANNPGNVRIFDYSACTYPEGFVRTDLNILFDHNQIEKVLFEGYKTPVQEQLSKALNDNFDQIKSEIMK